MIGVPARNEAERIGELVERVELGTVSLRGDARSELVLAYQESDDDTLERFTARPARLPHEVLHAPPGVRGKGVNIKLLLRYACARGVEQLLLVDADLQSYAPENVRRTLDAAHRGRHGVVLPLWCRPRGQGNTTNYLASPLLFATHRARIRQPIAGHMLLHRTFIEQLDIDALPDDYGIDVALTMQALVTGTSIGQVMLTPPAHPTKHGTSERVMVEVATALLSKLRELPTSDRADVTLPDAFWADWRWPRSVGARRDHLDVVRRTASGDMMLRWLALGDAGDAEVAEMWCEHLASALRASRSPHADVPALVAELVCPFFVYAAHRARRTLSVADLEADVIDLGHRLAARIHA